MSAPLTPERIAAREKDILERSLTEAMAAGIPDWIEDGDGTYWIAEATRGRATAFYAGEIGVPFTSVRCRREYMRVNLTAIREMAHDMAMDDGDDHPTAYTWEGDGWCWEGCGKDDERAVALWRCELRP